MSEHLVNLETCVRSYRFSTHRAAAVLISPYFQELFASVGAVQHFLTITLFIITIPPRIERICFGNDFLKADDFGVRCIFEGKIGKLFVSLLGAFFCGKSPVPRADAVPIFLGNPPSGRNRMSECSAVVRLWKAPRFFVSLRSHFQFFCGSDRVPCHAAALVWADCAGNRSGDRFFPDVSGRALPVGCALRYGAWDSVWIGGADRAAAAAGNSLAARNRSCLGRHGNGFCKSVKTAYKKADVRLKHRLLWFTMKMSVTLR